jgi:RIO-like serine/threonine protein kinase
MSRSLSIFESSNDKATPVSESNLTLRVENEILKAFEAIHSLGVVHGDIRTHNILVADGGNEIWIVDFECAEIIEDGNAEKESKTSEEMQFVKELLEELKQPSIACHHDTNNLFQNGVGSPEEAH